MAERPADPPRRYEVPPEVVALDDYESLAAARLTASAFAYIAGGAADELTLRENRAAFDRIRLKNRVLADLTGGGTALDLFGRVFDYPILLASIAHHMLADPDGEIATVVGAAGAKAGMVVSTEADTTLEEIAAVAKTPLWFQLYIQHEPALTRGLVQRAEAAGYGALVVTVDSPVDGARNRQARAGYRWPKLSEHPNLRSFTTPPPQAHARLGESLVFAGFGDTVAQWRDIAWLKSLTRLPVLLKGITAPEDAIRAVEEGVDGLIVSNHGGRVLDTMPASIDALPAVSEAIAGRVPLLLDGGIRRGTDVLKALALGASAVLLGRPYMYALAVAGPVGVAHALHVLRCEFEMAMALTGCRTLKDIGPQVLWSDKR